MESVLNLVSAIAAIAAWGLYVHRSVWLIKSVPQSIWARITRIGLGAVLATIAIAYGDRLYDLSDSEFLFRNWLVLVALLVTIAGHIGMLLGKQKDPT